MTKALQPMSRQLVETLSSATAELKKAVCDLLTPETRRGKKRSRGGNADRKVQAPVSHTGQKIPDSRCSPVLAEGRSDENSQSSGAPDGSVNLREKHSIELIEDRPSHTKATMLNKTVPDATELVGISAPSMFLLFRF